MLAHTARPFFSIVMPTHLRPVLLERAIRSLRQQSFQDFELIVVADAWERDSAIVLAELLLPQDSFVKRQGPPGPALSRNQGIAMAQGEWLIFLDDDDSFAPHHLKALQEAIAGQTADTIALFTDCTVVTEDRTQAGIPALSQQQLMLTGNPTQSLWIKNFIPCHALAYRRTAIADCRFDPHLASQEDWDFLLAVCSRGMPRPYAGGGVVMHKDYVNPGTRRGTQETSSNTTVILDFIHIYRRWPAPSAELKAHRKALLKQVELDLPLDWF